MPQKPANYDELYNLQVVDSGMMAVFIPPCDSALEIGKVFKETSYNQSSQLSMSAILEWFNTDDFEIMFRANNGDEIYLTIDDFPYSFFGKKNYKLSPENAYWNNHAKILYRPYTLSGGYYYIPSEENILYAEFTDSALIFSFCDFRMSESTFGDLVITGKLIYYFEE